MTHLHQIARYVDALSLDTIPPAVLVRVKTCLLYTMCMTVIGYDDTDVPVRAGRAITPAGEGARLFVTGESRSAPDAAFVNATLSCARGQNDTHPGAVGHAGCIVVPAVLAVAQQRGSTGADVLAALVAGYELLPKLAGEASAELVAQGWRVTPVMGPVITAAAIARLLGLGVERTAHAIALATQSSGGTMQTWAEGTQEWRIQAGQAARAGITAALLAEQGVLAASGALDGKAGFYQAFLGRVPALSLAAWGLTDVVFKPYPGCLINQAPIYLLSRLMREHGLQAPDIARIVVGMSPMEANYPGVAEYGPFNQKTGAVMSLAFMVATFLQEGTLTMRHFSERYGEHAVHALSRIVSLEVDPARPAWSFGLRLELRDGRVLEDQVPDQSVFAFGWADTTHLLETLVGEWPMADATRRYATLRDAVASLEIRPGIGDLVALCAR